uniref:Glycosyl transferase family 2 n=1 Tax=Cyanothece sp. (strain PCC 7425 / ATCC 29141) TaxID=395961 RepID=B8HND4_CYAP4
MDLAEITPLILTYNEAENIDRTLKQLSWAKTIIVIDSFSTDQTLDTLAAYEHITVFQRRFDTHAAQWNYGLEQISTEWVLSLDADYTLSSELITELQRLNPEPDINGYFIPFRYCVYGKPLKGTILPPRQALFRKNKARYIDDGHTQLLEAEGRSKVLSAPIYHDDRKPLSRWLQSQDRYMILEVRKLRETPWADLSWGDRLRTLKLPAPFIVLFYCLILKGGILDSWQGWYYALQRMLAEVLLAIRLIETEYFRESPGNSTKPTEEL